MSANARPDDISEIATILAKGYLRYRKSRRSRVPDPVPTGLDSGAEESVHVTVVNAPRTDGD